MQRGLHAERVQVNSKKVAAERMTHLRVLAIVIILVVKVSMTVGAGTMVSFHFLKESDGYAWYHTPFLVSLLPFCAIRAIR